LTYEKVGDFWLPAENHTQSVMRLSGLAQLSIEYNDYKILKAKALSSAATVAGK
jgi:predicted nucleotidyltransferase